MKRIFGGFDHFWSSSETAYHATVIKQAVFIKLSEDPTGCATSCPSQMKRLQMALCCIPWDDPLFSCKKHTFMEREFSLKE